MNAALMSELFGGADRYKALRCLFAHPNQTFGARDLAAQAGVDPGNASRWLRRWSEAGLLEKSEILRRTRYAASRNPALQPLQQLFQQESELAGQLREVVENFGGRINAAAIFGSVANGTDTAESDVDVILITDMTRLQAQSAFKALSRTIARPIDVVAFTPPQWLAALSKHDPLALNILSQPLVALKGRLDGAS